jgi:ribosomal protein S12 methylthiotransferase accessory factor
MSTIVELKNAFKKVSVDQDKTMAPEETVRRFKEKLATTEMDILQDTTRIDNRRLDIPVFMSHCGKDAMAATGTRKQMGKGATPDQAEASAIMELAERYSFFSFKENPNNFMTATLDHFPEKTIPFDMIAKSVHDNSADLGIAKRFFKNLPLKWTPAFNLTRQEEVFVPFDWFFMINEFNGPSAGNCTEEAVLQGICEIVERHVSSIVSRNKMKVPLIDPDSATNKLVREMVQKYRRAGITFFISDFSLDMGIPSVGMLAYDTSTFPEKSEIVWTAGTTPSPEKAISRALTEVAQLAGDFDTDSRYVASGLPKFRAIEDTQFIAHSGPTIPISRLPDISDDNMKVEVENCISALAEKEMEVFIVNVTHPRLGIPAFYTIVPGAHFRERAAGTSLGMFSAKMVTDNQDPRSAIQKLKEMETALPGKYYIKFYLGTCYLSLGNPDEALAYFHQALDLEPTRQDIPSIYSYIGVCFKEMEMYRKAIQALEEGKKFDPERTDIHNLMGFCYYKLNAHEAAIDCFKQVLQIDPGSAIDYANIASNYRDMGEKEKAVDYYERALALDPTISFALENLLKLKQ